MTTHASAMMSALLLTTAFAGDARAQATTASAVQAGGSDGLGDIVVTARRTEEKLQDVPVAITAFNAETLNKRNIVDVRSLANVAPGLSITEVNSPTTLIITLRGLGNTNPNTGSDATVGLYLNDVPINIQNGTNVGMFDMQSAQVLKGPQGTLFGRNTTGGALLLNAKKPSDSFEGYVQAGGTFFRVGSGAQGEAVLNVPLSPRLAIRGGIKIVDRDGYVRNILPRNTPDGAYGSSPLPYGRTEFKDEMPERSQAWRLSALWTPSDNVENVTFYDGANYKGTGLPTFSTAINPTGSIAVFAPFLGFPDPVTAYAALVAASKKYGWVTMNIGNTPLKLKTHNISNMTTIDLSDTIVLKNIVGYRHVIEEYAQEITGLPGAYYLYRHQTGGYNFSDELQLQGHTADNRLNWVTGLFYFQESRSNISDRTAQFGGIGPTVDYRSNSKSNSVFAQATAKLTDQLSFTAGLRYTIDKRRATLTRFQPDVTGAPVTCSFAGRTLADCLLIGNKTFNALTYTLSADYKIDPDTLVYIANRRGYRSGGFSATQNDVSNGFLSFKPEKITDYELGLKRDWQLGSDALLRTNIAVYHQDYSDIQRLSVDPNDVTNQVIFNAKKATVDGGELEVVLQPTRGIQITYGYSHVNPKYKNFVDRGIDYSNNTFSYAPRDTHTISTAITIPTKSSTGEVSFNADYHWQSSYFHDDLTQSTQGGIYPPETLGVKGYGMLGFKARWQAIMSSRVDAEIFVTNVTNKRVLPNGSPNTYTTLGNGIGFYAIPPRMIGFNLRYNFGE
jgi:iron complex outermembrane recepter protein